ncbi:asparagine synthase (glutamine-hydrolyzing) [Geomonas anaerohicana]|uniref:asparagine synthase (glutamine-hydrolyzing) n=1 Tax=Geomonas anaerohicana TaxID=2798583 RepID=A0ABS0YBN4_9BACT|nr:asparagine synthase (glutamine-hydrolyzing) [Geomonas anaerohicana]MBJ6749691.1 asparagine synthase (glutamine-hydrolyzing) [Geomonas anaerohicana]
MCGIFGILTSQPSEQDLSSSLELLHHRGPDDCGEVYWTPEGGTRGTRGTCRIALGHRRLSIIDLSAAGKQPMASQDGRWWIVFNGEVYNFVELRAELQQSGVNFRTKTDTEVVLMSLIHWGAEVALARFRGMFAIALLDAETGALLLARDPFGIKPLYVCTWRDGIAFSSETAPLLKLPGVDKSLDSQRTWLYLRFGVNDHGHETMLAGIRQVPPAHWGVLPLGGDLQESSFIPYWDPQRIPVSTLSFDQAVEQVRHLFLRNINWHLRSDVPVGSALSGGIDSSAIVCAIRHLHPDHEIHTFSYLADQASLSEEVWVDLVNSHIGAVVHPIRPSAGDLVADLEQLMRCQGEPFGSTSIYAQHRVFRAAHEAGIKVMLDGQGADEILAGYVSYQSARLASMVSQGEMVRAVRFLLAQRSWPDRSLGTVLIGGLGQLLPDFVRPLARKLVGKSDRPGWANIPWFQERGVDLNCPWYHGRGEGHLRSNLQESVGIGLLSLLRYEDRNSMAYSIESRVPFLTVDLAELLLSLPEDYLIGDDGLSKRVFRAAMRGIVPDPILDRRDKIGFATPELAWLRQHGEFLSRALKLAPAVPCLNPDGVVSYCSNVMSGEVPFSFQVWRLLNFIRWHNSIEAR